MGDRKLSELEGAVLGVIWSQDCLTPYAVRQRFARSVTHNWSASQGAIYPAIRRLEENGHLRRIAVGDEQRRADRLEVTHDGAAALARWVSMVGDGMGNATVDPIRTRANYLAVLQPHQRRRFLEAAEAATVRALDAIDARPPEPNAREFWALEAAALGARMEVATKIAWLRELQQKLR